MFKDYSYTYVHIELVIVIVVIIIIFKKLIFFFLGKGVECDRLGFLVWKEGLAIKFRWNFVFD